MHVAQSRKKRRFLKNVSYLKAALLSRVGYSALSTYVCLRSTSLLLASRFKGVSKMKKNAIFFTNAQNRGISFRIVSLHATSAVFWRSFSRRRGITLIVRRSDLCAYNINRRRRAVRRRGSRPVALRIALI